MSKFNEEVEILNKSEDFSPTQDYLRKELDEIDSGLAAFISQMELEDRLDKII